MSLLNQRQWAFGAITTTLVSLTGCNTPGAPNQNCLANCTYNFSTGGGGSALAIAEQPGSVLLTTQELPADTDSVVTISDPQRPGNTLVIQFPKVNESTVDECLAFLDGVSDSDSLEALTGLDLIEPSIPSVVSPATRHLLQALYNGASSYSMRIGFEQQCGVNVRWKRLSKTSFQR